MGMAVSGNLLGGKWGKWETRIIDGGTAWLQVGNKWAKRAHDGGKA